MTKDPVFPDKDDFSGVQKNRGMEESGEQTAALANDVLNRMLPCLPAPDDSREPDAEGAFEDRVLLLLAAAIHADGLLTYPEYELAGDVLRRIFGDRALQADMQARFHSALLRASGDMPREDDEQMVDLTKPVAGLSAVSLASSLAQQAALENVSGDQIDALLSGLDELARRYRSSDTARLLRESMEIAFGEERLKSRRRRLERTGNPMRALGHGLEQSALLGLRMGKAAVSGTAHLMQNVADMAAKAAQTALLWPERTNLQLAQRLNDAHVVTPVTAFNHRIAAQTEALARTAWTLGEKDLRRELLNFRGTLAEQPFRVTVLGEGKRGKSSLINALLGDELSPVRESLPETAAIAEFSYAAQARYRVAFLDEEKFAHVEAYLAGEQDNPLLQNRINQIRQQGANWRADASHSLPLLSSRMDLPDYLAVDGRYSSLVARVSIALPLSFPGQGMVLVDTPGLNSTDSFHDYLAYEESLRADCLVIVLDARRPDSASELRLLRKLAAAGRALSIIGVLTGIDRLNETESRHEVQERALTFLREACRGAEHLQVLGLVSLNAREAMLARCRPGENRISKHTAQALELLVELVQEAMRRAEDKDGYRARVAERAAALATQANDVLGDALSWYRSTLPSPQFLELLDRHAERLAEAAESHAAQARSVVAAAAYEVANWRATQSRDLDAWEDLLVLRVMDAVYRHADSLGNDFAKDSAWKGFDEGEAMDVARYALDEFLADQQTVLHTWYDKLRLFQGELSELALQCLGVVRDSADELGDICSTSGRVDHLLVKSNAHMRNLAVFLAGAGTGTALAGSLLNLAAWGGAALMVLTHPLALPGVALVGAAAYALHAVGNTQRRKAAFLERKRKKTAQWAAEARKKLEAELDEARDEITAAYKSAVARGFVPALEILAGEAAHLRLYLKVMDKIRDDADGLEQQVQGQLHALTAISAGAEVDTDV